MKKNYHLCLSAGNEVIFRDLEDYNRGFNCFALALYKTGSTGLVESFMSTHTHQLVQTVNPNDFMYHFRLPYSMYFNQKYHRHGRVGENSHFTMEVVGYHHTMAAASYVLRNALHHGVVPIPYAYPHCSVNSIFRKEMGKFQTEPTLPTKSVYRHIGTRAECPSNFVMSESGVFLRESVLDKMVIFENGKADYRSITDIELCTELDAVARNRFNRHSVYQLTESEKNIIANELYYERHLSKAQIQRCLVIL